MATVKDIYTHENTEPPTWTLGVVADLGHYWLCTCEEIETLNPDGPK